MISNMKWQKIPLLLLAHQTWYLLAIFNSILINLVLWLNIKHYAKHLHSPMQQPPRIRDRTRKNRLARQCVVVVYTNTCWHLKGTSEPCGIWHIARMLSQQHLKCQNRYRTCHIRGKAQCSKWQFFWSPTVFAYPHTGVAYPPHFTVMNIAYNSI
jgi:hypothetical protein